MTRTSPELRRGVDSEPVWIETARLVLHLPSAREADAVLEYFRRNREHLEPWEPARAPGFYTRAFWTERLERNRWEWEHDLSMRLFARMRADPEGAVVGSCSFNNIIRGAFQACNLGYSMDAECQGQGLMAEALRAAIDYVFAVLGLHRVQANYQPVNERSAALLRRLGFVVEGYARNYLFIDGAWRDHVLTSRIRP